MILQFDDYQRVMGLSCGDRATAEQVLTQIKDALGVCTLMARTGIEAMTNRQNGMPKWLIRSAVVVKRPARGTSVAPAFYIMEEAYDLPRLPTEEERETEVLRFGTDIMRWCVMHLGKLG